METDFNLGKFAFILGSIMLLVIMVISNYDADQTRNFEEKIVSQIVVNNYTEQEALTYCINEVTSKKDKPYTFCKKLLD